MEGAFTLVAKWETPQGDICNMSFQIHIMSPQPGPRVKKNILQNLFQIVWNTSKCGKNIKKNVAPASDISRVSCQKGPTRHAYAWQIGPFWQDIPDGGNIYGWHMTLTFNIDISHNICTRLSG